MTTTKKGQMLHKKSNVFGRVPSASTLGFGEIAVNYNEKQPFLAIKTSGETNNFEVVKISSDKIIEQKINDAVDKVGSELNELADIVSQNELVTADSLTELNDAINYVDSKFSDYATSADTSSAIKAVSAATFVAIKDVNDKADALSDTVNDAVSSLTETINNKVSSAYIYKGSKKTFNELPIEGNNKGDVWNVEGAHDNIPAGTNYAWDGTQWDSLAGIVDLTIYATSAATSAAIKAVNDKADALSNKLTEEIAKKADKENIYYFDWEGNEEPVVDYLTEAEIEKIANADKVVLYSPQEGVLIYPVGCGVQEALITFSYSVGQMVIALMVYTNEQRYELLPFPSYDDTDVKTELARLEREKADKSKLTELSEEVNKNPFEKGESENSAVLKGEYEGYSNEAISQVSVSLGAATTAGLKGWYYTHVNINEKKIFLGTERTKIAGIDTLTCTYKMLIVDYSDSKYTDSSFVSGYEVGDVLSIVYDSKYEDYATITAISGNVITLDNIPFVADDFTAGVNTKVSAVGQPDEFSVYCIKRQFNDSTKEMTLSKYNVGGVDFGGGALSEGVQTFAVNIGAHAEGAQTVAKGQFSHAEGLRTQANYAAHAEGINSIAYGYGSHAEGSSSIANGESSHAEGYKTQAIGKYSHTEGRESVASGVNSHAEGQASYANKNNSHAEGQKTIADGEASHSEGRETIASGNYSHAEGRETTASNNNAHAEGQGTVASGHTSHAEGWKCIAGTSDTAPTVNSNEDAGNYTHAEGNGTWAKGNSSHSEGRGTWAKGNSSHSEGRGTKAFGLASHAEGKETTASGNYSHAEGICTNAKGRGSHAEGFVDKSENDDGISIQAIADGSHAEGYVYGAGEIIASGKGAHAEGCAEGGVSDEKPSICATGDGSHAEGYSDGLGYSWARGKGSHVEGIGTHAKNDAEHAEGKYNWSNKGKTIHSVGIGSFEYDRKNAHEITIDGKHYILGVGGYDGTNPDDSEDVATVIIENEEIVSSALNSLNDDIKQIYKIIEEGDGGVGNSVAIGAVSQVATDLYNFKNEVRTGITVHNSERIAGQTIDEIVSQLDGGSGRLNPEYNSDSKAYIVGIDDNSNAYYSNVYMEGDTLNAPNGFFQQSDENLKTFMSNIEVDLEKIAQLPKKFFMWSDKRDENIHIGTSAQAVQELYPEIVKMDKNGNLTVDYSKLSVIALRAIDVLNEERKQMKADIAEIKNKLGL